MKLVRQPEGSYLCQACCAAMLAGVDLKYVLDRVHPKKDAKSGKPYLTNKEMARFLLDFNLTLGSWARFHYVKMDDEPDLRIHGVEKMPAMVGVQSKLYPASEHAVVWDPETKMILDPQCAEPQPLSNYKVYEWIAVTPMEGDE